MERQLHLSVPEVGGKAPAGHPPTRKVHRPISAKTRAVGRRGVAQARAALVAARSAPETAPHRLPPPSSSNARRRSAA